jgi:hypothetical protein
MNLAREVCLSDARFALQENAHLALRSPLKCALKFRWKRVVVLRIVGGNRSHQRREPTCLHRALQAETHLGDRHWLHEKALDAVLNRHVGALGSHARRAENNARSTCGIANGAEVIGCPSVAEMIVHQHRIEALMDPAKLAQRRDGCDVKLIAQ